MTKDRTFEDIRVGEEHAFEADVSEESMRLFRDMSGDENPLHTDDGYARSTRFGRRVVYGQLLNAFFSRLIGHHVPGRRALYLSQNTRFDAPCFVGDRVKVSGKVVEKNDRAKLVVIETSVHRLPGMELLASGQATAMVM